MSCLKLHSLVKVEARSSQCDSVHPNDQLEVLEFLSPSTERYIPTTGDPLDAFRLSILGGSIAYARLNLQMLLRTTLHWPTTCKEGSLT